MGQNFTPLYDQVLLKKAEVETSNKGGFTLVGDSKNENLYTVVSVGEGYRNPTTSEITPLKIKEGDMVVASPVPPVKITLNGETLFVYREADILGTLS